MICFHATNERRLPAIRREGLLPIAPPIKPRYGSFDYVSIAPWPWWGWGRRSGNREVMLLVDDLRITVEDFRNVPEGVQDGVPDPLGRTEPDRGWFHEMIPPERLWIVRRCKPWGFIASPLTLEVMP